MRYNSFLKKLDRVFGIALMALLYPFKFLRVRSVKGSRRILLIKFAAIGDTVLLIPAIRSLKMSAGGADLDFLCTSVNYGFLKDVPYISRLYTLNLSSLRSYFSLIRIFRKNRYDLVVDFEQWLRLSSIIAFLSGARRIMGFKTAGQHKHLLFDGYVKHSSSCHEKNKFLALAAAAGGAPDSGKLEHFITAEGRNKVDMIFSKYGLSGNKSLVSVNPGADLPRQLHPSVYAAAGRYMADKYGFKTVLTGGPGDKAMCAEIASGIGQTSVNLAGLFEICEMPEVYSRMLFVLCNNAGGLHLSCAACTPVIAFHGPTNPLLWGPDCANSIVVSTRKSCAPCLYLGFEYACSSPDCMESIDAADALGAVDRMASFLDIKFIVIYFKTMLVENFCKLSLRRQTIVS